MDETLLKVRFQIGGGSAKLCGLFLEIRGQDLSTNSSADF